MAGLLPGAISFPARAALADLRLPRSWGINTDVDNWQSFSSSLTEAIGDVSRLLSQTTLPVVREGLTSGSRGNDMDPILWGKFFDGWAAELARTKRQIALQVGAEGVVNPGLLYDRAWEERITHKFRTAAEYIINNPTIRNTLAWFIVINEPDWANFAQWNIPRLIRVHQLAYEAVKSVSPDLLVEGCTFADPLGKQISLRDLLQAGITRYCDFIGFHCYIQSGDTHSESPLNILMNMRQAKQNYGWPMRPIVCSETGIRLSNFPVGDGPSGYKAIEYWQHFNYMQMARYGVSRALYFSLGGTIADMSLVDYNLGYQPRPHFASMINALQPRPLSTLNGSFAGPENKISNWVVCYRPSNPGFVNREFREWSETHFLSDGRWTAPGTTDNGYMEMDKGRPKMVRRVLDGLDGRVYTAKVRVFPEGGTASLRVYGYDQREADRYVEDVTTAAGRWTLLQVQFTPRKSAVGVDHRAVISLEHDGTAICRWDAAKVLAVG
jgi:hypothetical protein